MRGEQHDLRKPKQRYEHFIGGQWIPPVGGEYFNNISPVNGKIFCQVPRSDAGDINLALDAAHQAKDAWGKTSVVERADLLLKITDRISVVIRSPASGVKTTK